MARSSEEISRYNTTGGKTDSNLSNDTLHVGGIKAEDMATKKYVQDYHGAKEVLLKEYIDEQNADKLAESKSYTDTVVANQDFSNFAELQDLNALDSKIEGEIQDESLVQKNYTDGKVAALASDVNANFDDVGQSINTLNQRTNELFTSVSNGKRNVAAAITDKGVQTASDATFDTMATNIRRIPTGGGEPEPYYVNTGDATAESNDILVGKTAYVKGEKVYGSHIDVDTSDADATAADIRSGKTAYVNGNKIQGILVPETAIEYPTYGTDTLDATAIASDILYGKTAYARGQKITGTLQNMEVEEIYGNMADYNFTNSSLGTNQPPDGSQQIHHIVKANISQDNNYMVRIVAFDQAETNLAIESFPMDENGIYYMASHGATTEDITYKKFRYSLAELGLENETAADLAQANIIFGATGLDGSSNKCLLIIQIGRALHFYTYHLEENGVIGQSYASESGVIHNYIYELEELIPTGSRRPGYTQIIAYPLTPNDFYCFINSDISTNANHAFTKVQIHLNTINSLYVNITKTTGYSFSTYSPTKISKDGRYFLGYDSSILFQNNIGLTIRGSASDGKASVTVYDVTQYIIDDYPKVPRFNNQQNSFYIQLGGLKYILDTTISVDNKKLIVLATSYSSGYIDTDYCIIYVFDIENLANIEQGAILQPIYTKTLFSTTDTYLRYKNGLIQIFEDFTDSTIRTLVIPQTYGASKVYNMSTSVQTSDTNNIIGVRYKNKYFYNIKLGDFTAGQPDVASGKTFIGYQGYPETGTAT